MWQKKAKEAGKCVILDPAPARELPEELIRGLTIVKPNQTEIMKVLGRADEALSAGAGAEYLKGNGRSTSDQLPLAQRAAVPWMQRESWRMCLR